jgi:hypothetical protein
MRGTRAKAIRRAARAACDPTITVMKTKGTRYAAVLALDMHGAPIIGPDGKPMIATPERIAYTVYWPPGSYRRELSAAKRGGRRTGVRYG